MKISTSSYIAAVVIPDAAYKIVRMCREHCTNKLSVIVPFMAKSAATLLSIGTDEIIMGPPSELGPIDPQILDKASETWGATQSIRDCVDFLEQRFKDSPDPEKTVFVLMPILDKLNPFMIGKYERSVKMSKQYAELLLSGGMLKDADLTYYFEIERSKVYSSHIETRISIVERINQDSSSDSDQSDLSDSSDKKSGNNLDRDRWIESEGNDNEES
ncbi:hypothetical protein ACF3MZ_13235 [Paenibacillaceae bacterium WGS1546]|uniref:SDH family Clp fold serine proteinase n=1 Tax=Cohnella sp. WGS1546 TaxID=3366810 RepID=UPI00372CED51